MQATFRSALPDIKVYDQLILRALDHHLPVVEKQLFLFLSGRYLKGIIAARANRLHESGFYFRENGSLHLLSGSGSLVYTLTENVYLAARSYYLFKLLKKDEAIGMVAMVLKSNRQLERQGFDFLLFNDIQQYHNLGRIHAAYEDYDKMFSIAYDLLAFLITCKGKSFKSGLMADLDTGNADYQVLRNLMTIQILSWLLTEIEKASLKYDITDRIALFFNEIRNEMRRFICKSADDRRTLDYLSVLLSFGKRSPDFEENTRLYLSMHDEIFPGANPHLEALVALSRNPNYAKPC